MIKTKSWEFHRRKMVPVNRSRVYSDPVPSDVRGDKRRVAEDNGFFEWSLMFQKSPAYCQQPVKGTGLDVLSGDYAGVRE